jgi:hypothetical protein
MTDITIPPEAVEAAKAAYTAEIYKGQGTATEYTAAMRAACLAMLKAWPGKCTADTVMFPHIILPLPQEPSND